MIQTEVIPQKENFDMRVSLPIDYVGKKVHVVFYIDDELKNMPNTVAQLQKMASDFFGILTREEGEKFDKHIQQIRGEWERDI